MNDLLGPAGQSRRRNDNGDLEDPQMEAGDDVSAKQFFDEVGEIKNSMAVVRRHLRKLQECNEESKLVTQAGAMKALKKRMQDEISSVIKVARQIKGMLEKLDNANLQNRSKPNCQKDSSTDRARMNITNLQKKKLQELMDEFNDLRTKFADEYKETVERRYLTVTGEKPDEALVEHMIDSGDAESIFRKAIQQQGRGQVIDTLKEIEERHDAVKEIEKQLLQLHQIFLDMGSLVESQGEMLDDIEKHVGETVKHTEAGAAALGTAWETKKNTRKWVACGVIALIIVIVIAVLVIRKLVS